MVCMNAEGNAGLLWDAFNVDGSDSTLMTEMYYHELTGVHFE